MAVRPESCGASSFLRADDGGGDNRHVVSTDKEVI